MSLELSRFFSADFNAGSKVSAEKLDALALLYAAESCEGLSCKN